MRGYPVLAHLYPPCVTASIKAASSSNCSTLTRFTRPESAAS